jgi:hypothetical protein
MVFEIGPYFAGVRDFKFLKVIFKKSHYFGNNGIYWIISVDVCIFVE